MIFAKINGEERPLHYSIEVMFDMTEKFGRIQNALEIIDKDGKESFEAVQWFAIHMANDAELCRRQQGYDKRKILDESDITMRMRPLEYADLREAVVKAITEGYQREIGPSEEKDIDLGLAELNEKN